MSLFSRIFSPEKSEYKYTITEDTSGSNPADGELVAVIMGALMNMLSQDAVSELHIKSIRRIGRNSPIWNTAGRDEYLAMKL